jgi:hypothetical protein
MFSVLLGLEPMRPGLLLGGGMMMGSILLMEARTRASAEDNEPAERSVAN